MNSRFRESWHLPSSSLLVVQVFLILLVLRLFMMYSDTRHFTAEQATRMLLLVKCIVSNVMEKGKGLHEFAEEGRGTSLRFRKVIADIQALKEGIEGLGCVYCDWTFQVGLVDFPAMIDSEKVFLCWSSDEEVLTYFHTKNEGFSNRKKIPPFCLQPAFATI